MTAGAPFGLTPYGTEAMHVLRAEKGFVIVGQDTDGTMTPDDLGMAWIVNTGEGRLPRQAVARAGRHDPRGPQAARRPAPGRTPQRFLPEGTQLVAEAELPPPPVPMLGYVSSSYRSADARPRRSRWPCSRPAGRGSARRSTPSWTASTAPCEVVAPGVLRPGGGAPGWLRRALTARPPRRRPRGGWTPSRSPTSPRSTSAAPRTTRRGSGSPSNRTPSPATTARGVLWLGPDEWLVVGRPGHRGLARGRARGSARGHAPQRGRRDLEPDRDRARWRRALAAAGRGLPGRPRPGRRVVPGAVRADPVRPRPGPAPGAARPPRACSSVRRSPTTWSTASCSPWEHDARDAARGR